ncbi:MAG: hypothetical protein RJA98_493 [Pseudomonadota bacterium]|jgi:hypothetical protein
MRTFHHASTRLVLTTALLLGLSACGGGGDDEVVLTPTADVPASASTTPTAFTGYVDTRVQSNSESAEPLDLSGVAPPTSDTDEPATLV